MKKIIYNIDNLTDKDINHIATRIKVVIKNSKDEILICYSNNNYFFPGGHLEKGESIEECLTREIKEEVGITLPIIKREPFMSIEYYNKNYPSNGINTKSIAYYYIINEDIVPNLDNTNLTEEEKKGNFILKYIDKNKIVNILQDSIKDCSRVKVVEDTISVLKEYLK